MQPESTRAPAAPDVDPLVATLTLLAVAKKLDVHVGTVVRWTTSGVRGKTLPSFFVGGRRRVRLADLDAFLAALNPTLRNTTKERGVAARIEHLNESLARDGF